MTKRFILTLVEGAAPAADSGLWNHPRFRAELYRSPAYWEDLARQLEAGGFDALFIADHPSVGSDIPEQNDHLLRQGNGPRLDPAYLIPLMARVTSRLNFVVTSSVTYDHPYALARKFATLDHLTDGRVGWNIVTTNARQAALNHGLPDLIDHDVRYDRADEFLDVAYDMWNTAWEDEAIIRDVDAGLFIDPSRVHSVDHDGPWFSVHGIPVFAPGPQRTPVLFQAGSSERGREFAARHAEVVYLNATTAEETAYLVRDVRNRAERLGRDPHSIAFLPRVIPVVGATRAEADAKYSDFVDHHDPDNAAFVLRQWAGIDVDALPDDVPLDFDDIPVSGLTSQHTADYLRRLSRSGNRFTKSDLLRAYAFGGEGNALVGTPESIADHLEEFAEQTGVDGFNIAYMVREESVREFIDHVVPELRRRGRIAPIGEETFRESLFGTGATLPLDHPGSRVAERRSAERVAHGENAAERLRM